jgi:addiction module HigA family antidote
MTEYLLTARRTPTMRERIKPIHPGEILLEQFLKPMGISQTKLAFFISVPPRRINEIVQGKRRISADTALRLGRCFGTSPQFWLGLQTDYDIDVAGDKLGEQLKHEIREYV